MGAGACLPVAPPQPPRGLPQALVATRRAETGHVAGAEGASAVHCNAAGRQAPAVRLVRLADLSRFLALVHESELARNEPDSQVHHLPRAYDDGLPSSAIRLRM